MNSVQLVTYPKSKEKLIGSSTLFFHQGNYHSQVRKLVQSSLSPKVLRKLVPEIEAIAITSLESWANKQIIIKHIPGDEEGQLPFSILQNLKQSYIPPFLPPPPTTYAPPPVKLDGRVTYAGTAAVRHHGRPKGEAEVAALPEIPVILN
nr:abscisic acid 8'-hydroxylase 4 [Ipomoea batatas]